ncbi:hypothetical protein [Streptomyces sp. NPDC055085]
MRIDIPAETQTFPGERKSPLTGGGLDLDFDPDPVICCNACRLAVDFNDTASPVFRCPAAGVTHPSGPYIHQDCLQASGLCTYCETPLSADQAVTDAETRPPMPAPLEYELVEGWTEDCQVRQGSTQLCWAAAAATAARIKGHSLSLMEAVHLYATSEQGMYNSLMDGYREAYTAARATAPGASFETVMGKLAQTDMDHLVASWGEPTLPPGLPVAPMQGPGELHDFRGRIIRGQVILTGDDNHWRVIFGYVKGRPLFRVFDPQTGKHLTRTISSLGAEQILIVE